MSAVPAIAYLIGLGFFGFMYWIFDGIQELFRGLSKTGNVYDIMLYAWTGIILVYIIFGGWWVVRKYNEDQYMRNGGF